MEVDFSVMQLYFALTLVLETRVLLVLMGYLLILIVFEEQFQSSIMIKIVRLIFLVQKCMRTGVCQRMVLVFFQGKIFITLIAPKGLM